MSAATGRDTTSWKRAIGLGVLGGIVGATGMAMLAMIAAASYQGTGFFTPMYHIASSLGGGASMDAMKTSMGQAQAGDVMSLFTAPALTGLAVHMATGMMWGALFGVLLAVMRIPRALVVPIGVAYGIAVMLVMAFVVLPVTAGLFGSGEPIRNMPSMVGWGTFAAEHALFGFLVGVTTLSLATQTARGGSGVTAMGRTAMKSHGRAG